MDFCASVAAQAIADEVEKGSSAENVVLSPMSIAILLNMVASGSTGETLDQFLRFLGAKDTEELSSNSKSIMSLLRAPTIGRTRMVGTSYGSANGQAEPIFSMANALWVDHGFCLKPSFRKINDSIYKALVQNVDLVDQAEEVKAVVNSWAEKETKGLIKNILSPSTKLSPPLCIANALYFKGAWETPFEASDTRDEDFHLLNGETTKVPFMTLEYMDFLFRSFEDFKLLRLPYQKGQSVDKQFSMYIFLPHAKDGLKDLVGKFNADSEMLQPANFLLAEEELVNVWIPKMKFSHDFEAKKVMKAKGLTLPFEQNVSDFSNMIDIGNIFIKEIFHKAFFEVNEEGTVAAAVSVFDMLLGCAFGTDKPPESSFVADHPFLFMIVEDVSKLVVFTGAVLNPLLG